MKPYPILRPLLLIGAMLGLGACIATRPTVQLSSLDGPKKHLHRIAATHADTRLAYFSDDRKRYCAEPMPDALREETLKILLDQKHKGNVSIKATESATVEVGVDDQRHAELERAQIMREMAGRDANVLVARELMYRLCELSLNFGGDTEASKHYLAAYEVIAAGITQRAAADASEAAATEARARKELLEVEQAAATESEATQGVTDQIITLLVPKRGQCTEEPIDADLLTRAAEAKGAPGTLLALTAAKSCGQLKKRLNMYAPGTLERVHQALVAAGTNQPTGASDETKSEPTTPASPAAAGAAKDKKSGGSARSPGN